MITPERRAPRPRRLALLVGAVTASLAIAAAAGFGEGDEPIVEHASATPHEHFAASPEMHTEAAHVFHDEMRKLWEDHVTWTRLAIVSFVDDLADLEPTVERLLRNQTDIGNAIKPYYGDAAGERLTQLLEGHINGAVDLLAAAKAGNQNQVKKASRAWYRNGKRISDFLSKANPENWPRHVMRSMMRMHLDQTLAEATQRLKGRHAAEVRTYDEIHDHILEMADALSDGIVAQFPEQFS